MYEVTVGTFTCHPCARQAEDHLSTAAVLPLDLVTSRLKAQHRTRSQEHYEGVVDALEGIVKHEGGASVLYTGIGPDVAKSVVNSFLFFSFYSGLRSRKHRPIVVLELSLMGAFAGASSRARRDAHAICRSRRDEDAAAGDAGRHAERGRGSGPVVWLLCHAVSRPQPQDILDKTGIGVISRTIKEGLHALYFGLQGELLKGSFSHGLTKGHVPSPGHSSLGLVAAASAQMIPEQVMDRWAGSIRPEVGGNSECRALEWTMVMSAASYET
ncbi:Mitochondrial substrate carrier family protein X [Tolypocladium capitatum]|uniref:Mitochondrial substrate carrier family protein X n=1 Tax=Tolypocladium capitatum TaxID=45235 RepID=A0A2K3Q9M0_9HYPO|nr:Mitochondrial substrate carrier family protein X [Tolypocladium capitatum]